MRRLLGERGLSCADLARPTGLAEEPLSQLMQAQVPQSLDVAGRLGQALGIPANLWLALERNYRAGRAFAVWAASPIKDLVQKEGFRPEPLGTAKPAKEL